MHYRFRSFGYSIVFALALLLLDSRRTNANEHSHIDDIEFFENRIRPVLVERCYECHNSAKTAEADLALDFRDGIRRDAVVVPGKPEQSLLLKVIRHEIDGLEMPDGGPKLGKDVIADFEKWIRDGAADPRDNPPTAAELANATSWDAILAKRKKWWSFQPIASPALPPTNHWSNHPIDRFVFAKMVEQGLEPAPDADRRTLIRRLSFALLGLPPTPQQIEEFVSDPKPSALEAQIDRMLSLRHFGERWARHWMDLVRYADSHGSEGDPAIPGAYQYRDYLIRAFNADVPYDQLLREHVAGDLLSKPRVNHELGINESAIGTAHWRLVFHGFAPTDALDEKVRFTDDEINVFGKAFLGLTISCARCHDHKFDAISQRDYYALFGILGSCRPAMQDVNLPERQSMYQDRLREIKSDLRRQLADTWLEHINDLAPKLAKPTGEFAELLGKAEQSNHVLFDLAEIQRQQKNNISFLHAWQTQLDLWQAEQLAISADRKIQNAWRWDLSKPDEYATWFASGNGLASRPSKAGEFAIEASGEQIVTAIYPGGVYSHPLSTRHRGALASPRVTLDDDYQVYLRLVGGGQALVRYVVQNYPRDGTVYPINEINNLRWYWHKFDLKYWRGDQIHLELATARDGPLVVRQQDRSWFGVREAVVRRAGQGAPHGRHREFVEPLFETALDSTPKSIRELADSYVHTLRQSIEAWRDGNATDAQSLFLNACLRDGLLPNSTGELPNINELVDLYRQLESMIPLPTRVPGIAEADALDQPLYHRGNHRQPDEPVRRRFLEAIDPTPYESKQSGRLELADDLLRPDNPLTARVIVNRIWHYLFGQGIVNTPDNFGQLGQQPTHPELLDYLASRMIEKGWSIKDTIRFILISRTWQLDSHPSIEARETDPQNRWLSHANVRRLDAEAIRDSLLSVSGELDRAMYGPGFAANTNNNRRSIYVLSRRNSMDQLLNVFDSPVPFATTGRRNVTNVPAQSLTMLNDPFVMGLARKWGAASSINTNFVSDEQRIRHMFETAIGRKPITYEIDNLVKYARTTKAEIQSTISRRRELEQQFAIQNAELRQILEPARKRLVEKLETQNDGSLGPDPIARWNFRDSLQDTIGKLDGKLHGNAKLTDGALVLNGRGYVSTPPIEQEIGEKTLEAWVQLADDQQRGGGVITIQDLQGNMFDSIVFGERIPKRWLAGSDNFRRTDDFGGEDESDAVAQTVHIAIAYDADGTIRGYRNGMPYGKPYRKSDMAIFAAKQSQVLFGLRHGAPNPKRLFKGRILEARLYDRALTGEEIAASAEGQAFVTRSDVLDALDEQQHERVKTLETSLTQLAKELEALGEDVDESEVWTRIAHALFNLKEFIYIR